jgi:hypothetical protein
MAHGPASYQGDAYQGDSYHKARQRRTARRAYAPERDLDGFELTEFTYFGKPATLATWTTHGAPAAILLSESMRRPLLWTKPLFWFGRRGVW